MKNFIAALCLTTFALSAFAVGSPENNSATLILKGTINEKISISIDKTNYDLNLITGHKFADATPIAVVTEKSNLQGGYKVQITSANNGLLKNAEEDSISYNLKYGSTVLTNASGTVSYPGIKALGAGSDVDLRISVAPQTEEAKVAGDYTDQVTFLISAN